MKTFLIIGLCLLGLQAFGQTTVFDRNQEIARYNQSHSISTPVDFHFVCQGHMTAALYESICNTMSEKDGYISCTKNNNQLVIQVESWMQEKDILDLINQFGFSFKQIHEMTPPKTN